MRRVYTIRVSYKADSVSPRWLVEVDSHDGSDPTDTSIVTTTLGENLAPMLRAAVEEVALREGVTFT